MSDDHRSPFDDLEGRLKGIELAVDSTGDLLYRIVTDSTGSRDKLRLWGEANEALEQTCAGLHKMASIADEARSLSRHLVVVAAPDAATSEPNRVPCTEGDAAATTTSSKIATAGATASGDTEERALAPDPQHAPAVAQPDERNP